VESLSSCFGQQEAWASCFDIIYRNTRKSYILRQFEIHDRHNGAWPFVELKTVPPYQVAPAAAVHIGGRTPKTEDF
jgi:hypothetical protein